MARPVNRLPGIVSAFATMVALHSGVGQVVDVSLLESVFQLMGPLISVFKTTGEMQGRMGAGLPYSVPRGTYQCSDGKWVGLSASSNSVGARVMKLLGLEHDAHVQRHRERADHYF